jgi:FixJ family two-component response regulator
MPGISGLELMERARAVKPGLRVIFMSGYTANAIEPGRIPPDVLFLEKPFTIVRLSQAIREAIGR